MRVLPKDGRKVRDPLSKRHLPIDVPSNVPESTYWIRRIRTGDVVRVAEPVALAAAPVVTQEQITDLVSANLTSTGEE